ncbi:MAG: rhodanese-like domain-containing protein [Algicola sp.]|nr:rhodanese-like domain-containing protein [Algicola sp.]
MKNITQAEWRQLIAQDDQAIIMDVRTPNECAEGILENALMVDIFDTSLFMDTIQKLDKSKSYYIYCRSGNRSGQACQLMENLGFEKTYNLIGGMMEWQGETIAPSQKS